jgi:hypothetical protein
MFKGRKPQWTHSILIWHSGLIEQLESPSIETLNRPELRLWIKGGTDFRVCEGDELFEWLTDVGYEFRDVPGDCPSVTPPTGDVYVDTYGDLYGDGTPLSGYLSGYTTAY